jgi:hypothetical protein
MKIDEFVKLSDRDKEKYYLHTEDGNDFDIEIFYHWNLKTEWNMKCEVCTEDQLHYLLIGTPDTREPKFCLEHYAEINQDAEFIRHEPEPEKLNHLVTFRFTSGEYSQIFYKVFSVTREKLDGEVKEYMRTYYGEPEESDADENCGNGWCYFGCCVALSHERTEIVKSYEWLLKELTAEPATINKGQ